MRFILLHVSFWLGILRHHEQIISFDTCLRFKPNAGAKSNYIKLQHHASSAVLRYGVSFFNGNTK